MPRINVPCPHCGQITQAGFFGILRLIRKARSDECPVCHLKLCKKCQKVVAEQ